MSCASCRWFFQREGVSAAGIGGCLGASAYARDLANPPLWAYAPHPCGESTVELLDYQRDAVAALSRHLAEHDDNPVVVLPTAAGKSICMAALIRASR